MMTTTAGISPAMRQAAALELARRQAAAAELNRRQAARDNLANFAGYTGPDYVAEPFHRAIAGRLDQVVAGSLKRLIILAPPQHGKSRLVSVALPASWLGKHPHEPVIMSSYAATLIESKSRQARELIRAGEFGKVFPDVRLSRQSQAVNYWELAKPNRGSLLAVGVGGPITGHGGRLGIIAAPFENWEQAQAPTYRNRVWDWYRGTFRTRIWEDGAIVIIMTRWHEDDLIGRLMDSESAGEWEILRLPAIAESQADRDENNKFLKMPTGEVDPLGRQAGEPLAPNRFSLTALESLRADVGALAWSAEYQGVPRPPEGAFFKRQWFNVLDVMPAGLNRFVRYWDFAGTEGDGCYTVGALMGKLDGRFYVADIIRGQWSAGQRDAIIKQTAATDKASYGNVQICFEVEPGSAGKSVEAATIAMLAGYNVAGDRPSGDKMTRAKPLQSQAEAGNVYAIAGKWTGAFLEEFASFPNGRYVDQVDATAGAFNQLSRGAGWVIR